MITINVTRTQVCLLSAMKQRKEKKNLYNKTTRLSLRTAGHLLGNFSKNILATLHGIPYVKLNSDPLMVQ